MPRQKNTIARDSVFRTTEGTADQPKQGAGPQDSATHQTAVWLGDEEVQWLDTQCQAIRHGGWRSITRSALIRTLIRAAMDQSVALNGVTNQAELMDRLATNRQ